MKKLFTARTIISMKSPIIMYFVMRSSPFCRLNEQIKKPIMTAAAMHTSISAGSEQKLPNSAATCCAFRPSSLPVAVATR